MKKCVCLFMKVRRDRGKNKRTEAESPFRHKENDTCKKKKSPPWAEQDKQNNKSRTDAAKEVCVYEGVSKAVCVSSVMQDATAGKGKRSNP